MNGLACPPSSVRTGTREEPFAGARGRVVAAHAVRGQAAAKGSSPAGSVRVKLRGRQDRL